MTTYYARSGFAIVITRPILTEFTGRVYKDGSILDTFGISDTNLSLNSAGEYTFDFFNFTANDPTTFRINNYDTGEEIATIAFPLTSILVLVAGIDGESDKNLTINYPLSTFTFANSSGTTVNWACAPLSLGQSLSWETTINEIPDPKIIGNLTGCAGDEYVGNPALDKSCDSESAGDIFLFTITSDEGTTLYQRIECCCPTVVPADVPGFVCTCPDFSKATSYNQTLFSSSISLQSWINSGAGAKGDCKHIMAAKRIMNIEQPVYSDPPYSAPPAPPTPM
jgi:hypothetical protein